MRVGALLLVLAIASSAAAGSPAVPLRLTDLRCEYRVNPLGVDDAQPGLTWVLASSVRGERQTAYRVQVASSASRLAAGRPDLWDSGRVASDQSVNVRYRGPAARPAMRVWWRVRVWGAGGSLSAWSQPAWWVAGMPRAADWHASWIAARAAVAIPGLGLGYHATEAARENEVKWVQVDLRARMPVDVVRLVPLIHDGVQGFGFPLRFRVEVADDASFATPRIVAACEGRDYPNPGASPVAFQAHAQTARFVRVTVTKLWNRGRNDRPFCFGLSELEVISRGRNVALGAPATAADSVEQWGWGLAQLTDGRRGAGAAGAGEYAAPMFRRAFTVGAPVVRATAFLCGLGYGELYINGRKVGDAVLDPAWTDYRKRVLYRTYDVTRRLKTGRNAIGVLLGNGWFRLPTPDLFGYERAPWVAPPKLLFHLRIERADGSVQVVASDASWRWRTSPITFNCVRGGETYDARMVEPGWSDPGFDDRDWEPVVPVPAPQGRLVPQSIPPIRVVERIRPVSVSEPKPGVYVFDLGRHIAGYARLTASGKPGQRIVLDFDENLNADGTITTKSLNSHTYGRYQTGELILSGRSTDVFEPRFTYHGFRYIQVRGLAAWPGPDTMVGLAVHTDLQSAGEFACSKPVLNRIHAAVRYAIVNCHHGIQTEPAREKVNWTEDAHNTIEPAMHNFDYATFARKWLDDVLDSQEPNGHVPPINPTANWGNSLANGMPPDWSDPWWAGVVVEIPWFLYTHYGDRQALARSYEPMKRYVDYLAKTTKDWPFQDWWLGDWLEVGSGGRSTRTPIVQCSTMAYYHYAALVGRAARILGHPADATRFEQTAIRIRDAYNRRFLDASTGLYAKDSQSAQAMPLFLGLAPDASRPAVLQRLVDNVADREGHISAGFVGYQYVLRGLTACGRADLAYAMATQEDFPSWGHMLENGGTTLWEAWDGNAFNFTSFGWIGVWLYESVAGIAPDAADPGFHHVIVRPRVVGDLTWARARTRTPYGTVASSWRREAGRFVLSVSVPCNSVATVWVPATSAGSVSEGGGPASSAPRVRFVKMDGGCAVFSIGSGAYRFVSAEVAP